MFLYQVLYYFQRASIRHPTGAKHMTRNELLTRSKRVSRYQSTCASHHFVDLRVLSGLILRNLPKSSVQAIQVKGIFSPHPPSFPPAGKQQDRSGQLRNQFGRTMRFIS